MTETHQRPTALLISHDIVGASMAGPGIRYYHLARVLAKHVDTVLAVPEGSSADFPSADFRVVHYRGSDWTTLQPHVEAANTCVFPSAIADGFPQLADSGACLVVDGYDPLLAEWLALPVGLHADRFTAEWQKLMLHLSSQYAMGDFFLCASERQRDWWLGLLEANGRINPATHRADQSLRNLIDVVAYGLPEDVPVHSRQVVKGVWNGISASDKVLVWGGGLWPWLDPVTAIKAIGIVSERRDDVRLIFPGTKHPNPSLAAMPTRLPDAVRAAGELGLTDKSVFFGDWFPYQDWANLLLECDLAISLHFDTLETRLAFRSRILEYIWCGLPIVSTTGDATSELVEQYDLGTVVDYADPTAVADAICRLLDEPATVRQDHFVDARQALTWETLAGPLIDYCRQPVPAADKSSGESEGEQVFFPNPWEQLRHERTYWQSRIEAYENGRFMRIMKWINRQMARIRPGPDVAQQIMDRGKRVTYLYPDTAFYAQLSIYRFASAHCQDRDILDVGSGDGYGAYYLAANGAQSVHGIDSDPQAIRFSDQHFQRANLRYSHMDGERLSSQSPSSVEVVLTANTLEYIYDLTACLSGIRNVLSPDGTFIASIRTAANGEADSASAGAQITSGWPVTQWYELFQIHFEDVACFSHILDKPEVTATLTELLNDTPETTVVDETDFTFLPVPPDRYQQGGYKQSPLSAVFLCKRPRPDLPSTTPAR